MKITENASTLWFGNDSGGKIAITEPSPPTNATADALTATVARAGAIPEAPATAPGTAAPAEAGIPAAAAVPAAVPVI